MNGKATMTKTEYLAQAEQLVGHRIIGVRYHEVLYTDDRNIPLIQPEWNRNPDFDSLDHGLEFDLEDGSICHVTWGGEFHQYGVSILRRAQQYVGDIRIWDVTNESRWRDLLNLRIVKADVYWSWVQYEGDPRRIEYPQSLRLAFEGGAEVYLSAFEIRDENFRMGCMDSITVFFDRQAAQSVGAWSNDR
jgi:hypothetical protein